MPRLTTAAPVVALAVALWLAVFFGSAWVIVWLVETFEGETSECWSSQCGAFGEFIDDHDLLATLLLAMFAALPSAALLWSLRARFTDRSA